MKHENIRNLIVEEPATFAIVDLLSVNAVVSIAIEQDVIRIKARTFEDENDSSWSEHEFEIPITKLLVCGKCSRRNGREATLCSECGADLCGEMEDAS